MELAQLKYLLPRLVGAGTALSRLGGGIGTRGPWRNEARNRPPAHPNAYSRRVRGHRAGAPAPGAASRAPAEGVGADRRAGRLHERGEDDAVQRADARGGRGVRCAVRHARSAHSPGPAARQPRAAHLRYGRVHRPPAARARRGVSRDARGGDRRRPDSARDGRVGSRPRAADGRRPAGARGGRRDRRAAHRGVQQVRRHNRGRTAAACRSRNRGRCAFRPCAGKAWPSWWIPWCRVLRSMSAG